MATRLQPTGHSLYRRRSHFYSFGDPRRVCCKSLSPGEARRSDGRSSWSGTVTVKVINWRNADLVELQATESGSANWKKVLGALKAGQWTSAKVRQGNNCRV